MKQKIILKLQTFKFLIFLNYIFLFQVFPAISLEENKFSNYHEITNNNHQEIDYILDVGDIIYIRKNILEQTTTAIKEYSAPILSSYALYKLFD